MNGKGSISVPGILELKNVFFVDGLKVILTSISQICNDKCLIKFNHKECTICDNIGSVVVKGIRLEYTYYYMGDSSFLVYNRTSPSVEELWHEILGHLNHKLLKKISSLKIVRGFPPITTIIMVVEDFSRYSWVMFMREKSYGFVNLKILCIKLLNEKR